jgi:hypothetical protein
MNEATIKIDARARLAQALVKHAIRMSALMPRPDTEEKPRNAAGSESPGANEPSMQLEEEAVS